MEKYINILDMLFDSNYKHIEPDVMKKIMKKRLDVDHEVLAGADYIIDRWKDGRLKYGKDEPLAVKALEML